VAKDLASDAAKASNLSKAFGETNMMLSHAITAQLVAQAALYIVCCASLVLACVFAVVRLKQLNDGLIESQKFVEQHKNRVKERTSAQLQPKELATSRSSDCGSDSKRLASASSASTETTGAARATARATLCSCLKRCRSNISQRPA
jgi:hypothetical protein